MPEVPTLVCLHALGASRHSFDAVAAELGDTFDVLALDLPGFGDEPTQTGTAVEDMVTHVISSINRHLSTVGWGRWLLVGHSMGGKVASIVAARTLDGSAPLFGLAGVVLLAGSPPSPEPMAEEKRSEMTGWALDGPLDEAAARSFIDANTGSPLPAEADAAALADLRKASPEAWRVWLQRGSREDWSTSVATLDIPALIIAGGADGPLGPDGQRETNGPVYPQAEWLVLDGAGHLLPHERPVEVAAAVATFWERAGRGPSVPAATAQTIAGTHTGARARGALAGRALADDPGYLPQTFTAKQFATLRSLADRVVPQDGPPIDLAARLDAQLTTDADNGWRFADLPPDIEAYRRGLDTLASFTTLTADDQDALLARVADGDGPAGALEPGPLAHWFDDVCDDLIRAWACHPANLARIGFDGFAGGGDGPRLQGFTLLGIGEREAWEPMGTTGGPRR